MKLIIFAIVLFSGLVFTFLEYKSKGNGKKAAFNFLATVALSLVAPIILNSLFQTSRYDEVTTQTTEEDNVETSFYTTENEEKTTWMDESESDFKSESSHIDMEEAEEVVETNDIEKNNNNNNNFYVEEDVNSFIIRGQLSLDGQTDIFEYTAPVTGNYRIDLGTDNVESSYRIIIKAPDKSKLANISCDYYTAIKGTNVNLNEGETYSIEIYQTLGYESYTINIGVPNPIVEVTENVITGKFCFWGQVDRYMYTAPASGNYKLIFVSDNVEANYNVKVSAPDKTKLWNNSYEWGKEANVKFEQGITYTIEVTQGWEYPGYEINIGFMDIIE